MYKNLLLWLLSLVVSTVTMAQKINTYDSNWKKVEAAEKKGLTKTAWATVNDIYKLAQRDNNDAQQIKACMYLIRYRNMVEDNSKENNIFFVDTLIRNAKAPAKNILQSMQAEMYWQFLQNNRYKFYDRTKKADEKSTDINTWSLDKVHQTISKLYKASLQSEVLLKETSLESFEPIIIKGENTRQLRPTLFDFLSFRSLDYFMTDENDLTKPAYEFTLNDPAIFVPAAEFAAATFTTKDTASLQFHALQLFQRIIRFHLKDVKADALLDADLERLSFVNQYSVIDEKEKLYEVALKHIEDTYSSNPASAEAMYRRAKIYFDAANNDGEKTDPLHQYDIKRAKELCDAAYAKFPKSEGGINAANLVKEILQPSLQMETEKVNLPNQPFRSLVKYKNAPVVYFRLVKTSNDEIKKLTNNQDDKMWQHITALTALKSWQVDMPDPKDFREHSAEIKVDAVSNGTYYLLSSLDKNFSLEKNIITSQVIYVSSIASISNQRDYYVLNRETGQPLAKASVQVWENKYNYKTSTNENIKAETYSTDNNGFFKLVSKKENRNISLQIKTATDELHLLSNDYDNGYYDGNYQTPSVKPVSFLFTDRSIYRPGQTVYFKGIVIKTDKDANKNSVLPGYSIMVFLKDANGQKIQELKMLTNEYGSYHGSFKLPEGSLNGNFSLLDTATNGNQYFNVEEYKRPKFLVEVQKPEGSYRVNDSITVTGTARAYAGNNVDGAAVKFRVVRKVRYPIWFEYGSFRKGGRYPYGRTNEMEITNGVTTTDADGKFKVTFKALPDESISKKDQPTFFYEVSADVTDINGESRSGETSVAVAYQALQLEIKLADKLPADSLKTILIRSTNLNDLEEKTTATVVIEKLKSPGKIFRERYWEEPDQFVISQQEYYSYFPFDVYKNEDEVKHFPVGEKVFEKTDSSNREWSMVNGGFKAGWYKITATTKDKFGEEVKAEKYIQLTNEKNAGTENAIDLQVTKLAEPGEKVKYNFKTGFDKIHLIQTVSKMNDRKVTSYVDVSAGKPLEATETVTEIDRGGIAINYVFIKNNRVYKGNEAIDIPRSNKELNISYSSFRDKLLPGAKETWTVKISGSKGDKVAAEMLAGMYDASLDQFRMHSWNRLNLWPNLYVNFNWNSNGFGSLGAENYYGNFEKHHFLGQYRKSYDRLINIDFIGGGDFIGGRLSFQHDMNPDIRFAFKSKAPRNQELDGANLSAPIYDSLGEVVPYSPKHMKLPKPVFDDTDGDGIPDQIDKDPSGGSKQKPDIQIRKNFNETAFFFPDLKTDADGNVSFSFTIPEALTKWKLLTLAHTKDAANGYSEKTLVTQKPLMVQPNAPRFMREGDNMEFSAKIVNLSDSEITGTATLELLDAATNKPVDGWFKNVFPNQFFTVAAGQSAAIKFPMEIPFNFNSAMTYRITAASTPLSSGRGVGGETSAFSDGEENSLPILTNRMLVTESLPLNLRNTDKKDFKFEKLLNSGGSQTITNHAITVEFSSNPAWYAVQALPYLMEYPYECAEQKFNRLYANTLAGYVTNSMPKIKAVFERWRTASPPALSKGEGADALLSNLQKNEELKAALLEETPWVMDAQNETQQKKNIALLFDMTRMAAAQEKAFAQLKEMQSPNGGFVWFKGGPDDRYITQYIITGIGHLRKLKAISATDYKTIEPMVDRALIYLDKKIKEDYDNLVKYKAKLSDNNLSYTAIQYLYMRSFFTANNIAAASQKAVDYYVGQSKKYWLSQSKYMQGMIALSAFRMNDSKTAKAIIISLKENSISNEEMGMYWKDWADGGGYYWHQAPIESQAMMIEAFTDIDGNTATINDLKTWLLKQKQTQNWRTTKATAEACYALLMSAPHPDKSGDSAASFLSEEPEVTITLGNFKITSNDSADIKNPLSGGRGAEAGTGYFKKRIEAKDVQPNMGNISVRLESSDAKNPLSGGRGAWGAIYWQYFEDLDKITPSATPLKLSKKLFIERNTDKGPVLDAVADGAILKVGDKIKVSIELRVDRDMEYLHMKDMRAACMEPVNVLSGYKYQGGLEYYESTKDASTNFFFNQVRKGSYVFEYSLFVTHSGDFSNGITTIQCMYAPEFNSHSEGIRVKVETPAVTQ